MFIISVAMDSFEKPDKSFFYGDIFDYVTVDKRHRASFETCMRSKLMSCYTFNKLDIKRGKSVASYCDRVLCIVKVFIDAWQMY